MDSNLKKGEDGLMNAPETEEENELKLLPSNEIQAKLLGSLKENRMDGAVSIIIAALELGEFEISDQGTESIIDEYFDTKDFIIQRIQSSFRVRRKEGKATLTIKTLIGKEYGRFKRQETSQL